jgi:hypothetical protein
MSIEGIWTGEVYGPFGWDNRGIFVLENGRIIGGDSRQYSMGSYRVSGENVEGTLLIHYYGPPRTLFGEAREEFTAEVKGVREGDEINATISRVDKPMYDLRFRLTKRMDLPKPRGVEHRDV